MRFTCKASTANKQDYQYRGLWVSRYKGGWLVDGDNNIYRNLEHAFNAIDERLGGAPRCGFTKRHQKGIVIIGQK